MQAENPFTERGRITDPSRFAGRWSELSLLFERLESSRPLPGVSLEQAAKGLRGSMEKHGIKVLETTDAKLGGVEAKRIVYSHRLDTPQVKADVKAVIYIVMRDDWTYGVDVRATEQTYDEFLPVAQKVIDSFTWTSKSGGDDKGTGK